MPNDAGRVNKSLLNNGWTSSNGWKPSLSDVAVRDAALPIVKQKIDYLNSTEYKKRLIGMGEKNPDQLIKDRINGLLNVQFFGGQEGSSMTNKSYSSNGADVQIAKGSGQDVISHELGHVTSGLSMTAKAAVQGQADAMSPVEAWQFINKDKNLTTSQKSEVAKYYQSDANNFGQYMTDPAKRVLKNMDPHDISSSEAKGDLDAMRFLLNKNGFTQKYGQDIDNNILMKALEDKKFGDNKFIKRLKSRYSNEDIIKLNNTVASNDGPLASDIA